MAKHKSDTVLKLEDLGIHRGNVSILHGVSWTVRRGEHWVMLGANGSGKTSLLAALTSYLTPSGGEIELLGERYGESDWRELRKKLGIVSSSLRQMMAEAEPALITVASGREAAIDYWGEPAPEELRAARKLLRLVEAEYLADRPWEVLSQGERQRVLIARALMAKPALLILDEPCAGLDPVAREHFLQFLERLARQKNAPTLILVTHHVEEISSFFTHVLLLKGGAVLAAGTKRAMLTSEKLSATFGDRVKLKTAKGRYQVSVHPTRSVVV